MNIYRMHCAIALPFPSPHQSSHCVVCAGWKSGEIASENPPLDGEICVEGGRYIISLRLQTNSRTAKNVLSVKCAEAISEKQPLF